MSDHTPGPWHVMADGHRPWTDALTIYYGPKEEMGCYADGGVIAYTTRGFECDENGGLPSWANARLIAAAPDLLMALRILAEKADAHVECADEVESARAAITKATVPGT